MRPAGEVMAEALDETAIRQPVVPVVTNVAAGPAEAAETIRQHLVEQVTGRVRWRESVAWMSDNGIAQTAEAGAGKVLTVMNRRNVRALKGHALGTPDELAVFVAALAGTE